MAYELHFVPEPPSFYFTVSKTEWEKVEQDLQAYRNGLQKVGRDFQMEGLLGVTDKNTHVILLITPKRTQSIVQTISILLTSLNSRVRSEKRFYEVIGLMFGNVSGTFRKRLRQITENDIGEIVGNMQQAFTASVREELIQHADDCWMRIYQEEQRFVLGCFGDACDTAIYPDGAGEKGYEATFDAHNLDASFQQLTLLAGFLTLAEKLRNKK